MMTIDLARDALQAVATRNLWAPALVFASGAVSSVGPCTAPRFIAVAGITAHRSRGPALGACAAFIGGLVAAYAGFGAAAIVLARVLALSGVVYALLATVLAAAGAAALWRDGRCTRDHSERTPQSLGGVFLLGASFALVVSPCCTSLVAAILASSAPASSPGLGAMLLAAFAAGHTAVLFLAAFGAHGVSRILQRYAIGEAGSVIGGTLMLALAAFYGALA